MEKLDYREYDNILLECKDLSIKKNNDYGCKSLMTFGNKGIIIRISDKIDRLINLIWHQQKNKVNEKIEDTCKDIINYCIYLIMISRKKLIKNEKK